MIQATVGIVGGLSASLALFVVARVAMRIVALAAGLEPTLTLTGNLFLVGVLTASLGMPAGLAFVLVAPHSWRTKGLSYGGVLFLLFFSVFFGFGAGDLEEAGLAPQMLAVSFVSLSWFIFGVTLSGVVARLESVWASPTAT